MLLAIDCGNTNTVFSIWDGTDLSERGARRRNGSARRISITSGCEP